MTPPQKETWHFKKEIQVSHLITTITIAVAAVVYAGKIEQRVALLEAAQVQQRERDERQDKATADAVALVRSDIQEVSRKLDRLIEKR